MAALLRRRSVRAKCLRHVASLVAVLKHALNTMSALRAQTLYNSALCLWLLSFEPAGGAELAGRGAIAPLIELLKEGNKEKVMRIALMALARTLEGGGEVAEAAAVDAGLPRLVKIRSAQAWADEDVPDLLEKLDERLGRSVVALSSWDKYRAEVLSGDLEWTPMHRSSAFWQENTERFEEKDWQVLRCLIRTLEGTRDAKVAAVACSDLAAFADAHPHGRFVINDLGGKAPVMARMADGDGEVAKHALLCVQRLMLGRDKLDFLRRPGGDGAAAGGRAVS